MPDFIESLREAADEHADLIRRVWEACSPDEWLEVGQVRRRMKGPPPPGELWGGQMRTVRGILDDLHTSGRVAFRTDYGENPYYRQEKWEFDYGE